MEVMSSNVAFYTVINIKIKYGHVIAVVAVVNFSFFTELSANIKI